MILDDYGCLFSVGPFASRLAADRQAARRMHRGSYPDEIDFASKMKTQKDNVIVIRPDNIFFACFRAIRHD